MIPRLLLPSLALLAACTGDKINPPVGDGATTPSGWECAITEGSSPNYSQLLGCQADFDTLAADALDASIPGAKSMKTVLDRVDDNALYFQNTNLYSIHWEFAAANLSGDGLPFVTDLGTFNSTEYTSPDRRFVLGAITYYEEPAVWAYELSPYDTASAEMIELAYTEIVDHAWFGDQLYFHPTSTAIEAVAEDLSDAVKIITTDELFAGITYQPLNLGSSMGKLAFHEAAGLDEETIDYREIVVLDSVPNTIAVVSGIITGTFQTPLSHINVLSQNRGTPNMALTGAMDEPALRELEGKWVELTVGAFDWSVREVSQDDADAWWESHKPDPVDVTPMDTSVSDLIDDVDILDLDTYDLKGALSDAIPRVGGKGAHFGGLAQIGDAITHPNAFVIPVYWYDKHMRENGFWDEIDEMMADPEVTGDAAVRSAKLADLRARIEASEPDPELVALVEAKIRVGVESGLYWDTRFRFRSSTNAEDVNGFNGAGLYTSITGDPDDEDKPVAKAITEVWASVWNARAWDERSYYSIDHRYIGMALLCHPGFPDEMANGVAITGNIYDISGVEPAFYINAQVGDASVVLPDADVTTDQLLYYSEQPGQPTVYLGHSNQVEEGETVLDYTQVHKLGEALSAVHEFFYEAYGDNDFYAMDVEWKLDVPEGAPNETIFIKQARPYPGWNNQ